MAFVAECFFCGGKVRVPDDAAGWSVTCPHCGDAFTLAPGSGSTAIVGPRPEVPRDTAVSELPKTTEAVIAVAREKRATSIKLDQLAAPLSFLFGSTALLSAALASNFSLPLILVVAGAASGLLALSQGGRRTLSVVGLATNALAVIGIFLFPRLIPNLPAATQLEADRFAGKVCRITTRYSQEIPVREVPVMLEPSDWVDMDRYAIQQDDVRLRVVSVSVGPVPFKNRKAKREVALMISLRLYHVGSHRKIHYESWNQPSLSVRDDTGKSYPLRVFGPETEIEGQVRKADMEAMGQVKDLLIFEAPRTTWRHLRLELPASAYGSSGTLRLEIPSELLATSAKRREVWK
jgi:hypothetical protein